MKKLKQFRHRVQWGTYDKHTLYIVAKSQKQVIQMLESINIIVSANDIRNYFGTAWGTNSGMEGIEPTEPCVYAIKGEQFATIKEKPIKLV